MGSAVGLLLDPAQLRLAGGVDGLVVLLRRARSRGVTTFEWPSGAGAEVLERAIAKAFPEPDPKLTLLSEHTSGASAPPRTTRTRDASSGGPIGRALAESNERLRPHSVHLVEWAAREDDDPDAAVELARLVADSTVEGVVRRLGGPGRPDRPSESGTLWSAPVSLLDDRAERRLAALAESSRIGVFARDPFDGGRLDGRRLADSVGARRPDAGPVRLRELEQEFAPVLGLGFLTEGRRRTLAQAAIQYALRWPWVCSVLVPLPAPERLEEILAAESTPPISDDELERLAVVARRG